MKSRLLSKPHGGPPSAATYLLFPALFLAMPPSSIFCSGRLFEHTTPVHIFLPTHRQILPAMPCPTFATQGTPTQLKPSRTSPGGPNTCSISCLPLIPLWHFALRSSIVLSVFRANCESPPHREYVQIVSILSTALDLTQGRSSDPDSSGGERSLSASEPAQVIPVGMIQLPGTWVEKA